MDKKSIFFSRVNRFITRNMLRFFSKEYYINLSKWRKLKGYYKGSRVFLIGNGPSLNETPLYLLKNEYTLTFNRFSLLLERINWNPSFFMTVDSTVAENIKDELNVMSGISDYSFFPDIHKSTNLNFKDFVLSKNNVLFMHQEPFQFSKYLPYVGTGGSVIYEGFQVLNYLGFDEIYFLGVDMNYIIHSNTTVIKGNEIVSKEDDDPNHFDPRYFGKGKKYHQPDKTVVANIFKGLDRVAKNLLKKKSVINCGYNSAVNAFPKKDFMNVLDYTSKEVNQLFEDLVIKHNYSSLEDFLQRSNSLISKKDWNDSFEIQSLPTDEAKRIIKNKVINFLPIGPYKNRIYFINRNYE